MHPANWHEILFPHLAWLEKAMRPLLVYVFLMFALRLSGKRELAQATLFDFLVVLLISNVVQNAMIGEDNSVFGAFVGTVMLLLLSWLLNRSTTHSEGLRAVLEGTPTMLVRDGKIITESLDLESVALNDLYTGLRLAGVVNLSQVKFAFMELNGQISVIRSDTPAEFLTGTGCVLPRKLRHELGFTNGH